MGLLTDSAIGRTDVAIGGDCRNSVATTDFRLKIKLMSWANAQQNVVNSQ